MNAVADPTLASLEKFDDPSLWVIVPNVPIFDEHDEVNKEGKVVKHFGAAELQRIASVTNRMRTASGVVPRVSIGHTRLKNPVTGEEPAETSQPPIVGFAPNGLKVGNFGPEGKLGILTDLYYKREDFEQAKEFPYRSVELYPNGQLTGIAILKRDPQLDLGMTLYSRTGPPTYFARAVGPTFYEREPAMPEDMNKPAAGAGTAASVMPTVPANDDKGMEEKCMAMMHKHPAFQYACKRYQDETGDTDMGGMGKHYAAALSGTNGGVPEPVVPAKPPEKVEEIKKVEEKPTATQMQRTQVPEHYARLEQEVKAMRGELEQTKRANADLVLHHQRSSRALDLKKRQDSGIIFDFEDELNTVTPMAPAMYQRHLSVMDKNYQRSPVGQGFIGTLATGPDDGLVGGVSEQRADRAIQYMREQGCSWEDALKNVKP